MYGSPQRPVSVLRHRWQGSSWEPSLEPFAVDDPGRPWTPMESKALNKRPNALLWTSVDGAWEIHGSEGWGSSPSGRAAEPLRERASCDSGSSTV